MSDPVNKFVSQASAIVGAPAPAGDQPRVPFASSLRLSAEQEKKMIEHAFKRFAAMNTESGRDATMTPTWWLNSGARQNVALAAQGLLTSGDTFMGKRARFDATFLNDVSWRPFTMGPDTIFNQSNISVPLVRRICRQMIARAKNMVFGSDPWFAIEPAPVPEYDPKDDEGIAQRVERFCRFKARESNSREDKERGISRAFVIGECAMKTSYVVRDQLFNVEATVLMNVDGTPMRAADGNHITEGEQFVDAEDGSGRRVLARDRQTEEPMAPIYQKIPLDRRQVLFEGAKSEPIFFKDFLCPLTATDVQTADCIIHLYDKPLMEFVDLVVKRGMVGDDTEERKGAAQKMLALIRDMANNTPAAKAAVNQTNRPNDNYQQQVNNEGIGPISEFAEFYMWFDANEDGVAENIMLIADRKTKAPIYYEHVANVTTDGLRPIEIVRVNPVEGRWYGMGIMELFESYGTITDLLVNRWNFSQSRSGRVDLWTPTNTQEGERDPSLKMNWGGTYTKKPGMKAEDVLETVYLTDTKFEQIHEMIEFFMQLAMNESGVTNANDDQAAGMQSAKLATGIIEVKKSGDELFQPLIQDIKPSLERVMNREVCVTLANMNPVEVYTYLEGDTLGIDKLTPDDVRGLKYKTVITLTAMHDSAMLQMSAQAAALVEKFYMLTPEVQAKVAPFYRQQLRVLDPKADVNTAIQPNQPQPPEEEQTKTAVTVALKGENLTPFERSQLFTEKLGITETPAQAAKAPAIKTGDGAKKDKTNGSTAKLGDPGPAGAAAFNAQLSQAGRKKAS
jgi:hypothetical protein